MKTIDDVLKFVFSTLPGRFDITPTGEIVNTAEIGSEGYAENEEFTLCVMIESVYTIDFFYYSENGEKFHILEAMKNGVNYVIHDQYTGQFKNITQDNLQETFGTALLNLN